MVWNQLYSAKSAKDKGTLTQLQNVIYRSNVPSVVKNNFSAAQDFFDLVVEAHVTAAALQFFGMSSVDNLPTKHVFPPNHNASSASNRKHYLHDTLGTFVDEFIFHYADTLASLRQEIDNPTLEEGNTPSRDLCQLSFGIYFKPTQACTAENELENCKDVGAVATQLCNSLFLRAPAPISVPANTANDGELCFLCLKFTQQEDRVVSSWGKSCLAYGPLLQLEGHFSCPGSSALEGEGTEKRKQCYIHGCCS